MGFLFGSRGPNKEEKRANQLYQSETLAQSRRANDRADSFFNLSLPFFKQAGDTLGQSRDYFSKIMLDPYQGLAPELADEQSAYENVSRAGSFGPRGGGAVSRQAGLDAEHLHGITNIIAGGRAGAARDLGSIGAMLAQIGGGAASGGTSSAGMSLDALNAMQQNNLRLQNERMQRSGERWDSAGATIGSLLSLFA